MSIRPKPVVESLEPRCLLAAVGWDGGGDGVRWEDLLNWDGDAVPGAGDDVTIDVRGDSGEVIRTNQSTAALGSLHR